MTFPRKRLTGQERCLSAVTSRTIGIVNDNIIAVVYKVLLIHLAVIRAKIAIMLFAYYYERNWPLLITRRPKYLARHRQNDQQKVFKL